MPASSTPILLKSPCAAGSSPPLRHRQEEALDYLSPNPQPPPGPSSDFFLFLTSNPTCCCHRSRQAPPLCLSPSSCLYPWHRTKSAMLTTRWGNGGLIRGSAVGGRFDGVTVDGFLASCDGCGFAENSAAGAVAGDGELERRHQWPVHTGSSSKYTTDFVSEGGFRSMFWGLFDDTTVVPVAWSCHGLQEAQIEKRFQGAA